MPPNKRINRRFARCFQVNTALPGTAAQRELLWDALNYLPGTPWDELNLRLARQIKGPFGLAAKHIPVAFTALPFNWLGHAGAHFINLSVLLAGSGVTHFARHETGHLIDMHLLTDEQRRRYIVSKGGTGGIWRDWYEQFADDTAMWISDPHLRPWMTGLLLNG